MPSFFRRFIYTLSNKARQKTTPNSSDEKLVVDFARTKKSPFDIKSESSYNAYLSNGSLELGLKKSNCIAWVDIPDHEYRDHVIEAKIRLDSLGGYASTGVIFRITDQDSYYLALVSNKGYFRVDVIKDSAPKTLIAWTEISDFDGTNINLNIITYGTFLIIIINGKWVGEANDDSIDSGRVGFVLASYEAAAAETDYACKAWLDYLSVDARYKTVEAEYKKWTDDTIINAEGRLRLAETFAVMGEASKAMNQIYRAWKRRDEAISAVSTSYTEVRTRKELLLAARMSLRLGQYNEAEEFVNSILEQWPNSAEGKAAHEDKIKILTDLNKFAELKKFLMKQTGKTGKDINYYALLARCHWELKEYKASAKAWDKAFKMNSENGVYAVNAASALDMIGMKEDALARFLEAGKIFLKEGNGPELEAMIPKLAALGENNWEARALIGKWAFSIEDYDKCAAEFTAADKLRRAITPPPDADPALFYLWGLVLNIKGKSKEAIRLLEKAVKLAPDYGLFRFKLAEIKLETGVKDPKLAAELKTALELSGDDPDGKMANHAGNLLQKAGYAKQAEYFFDKAKQK
jgi:tetratricopeptide (TPR) repeat protein